MAGMLTALFVFTCMMTPPEDARVGGGGIRARVDPRVELMCIVFRLSGANEYNQPNAKSPYSDDVDAHFAEFRDHAVVRMARDLRARRGIGYDAVMDLAVHLKDIVDLEEKIPFDKAPPGLDARWHVDEAREFLKHLRDFARDTKFRRFAMNHRDLYDAAAARMTQMLDKRGYRAWFDSFFGARPGARFRVIVAMLNGPCNYGVSIRYPNGREEICPVLGVTNYDEKGIPIISDAFSSTVVHEFCHAYTNPIVDKHAKQLEAAGKRVFAQCEQVMVKQAYSSWRHMMYESLVRVCVVRYMLAVDGEEAARKEIERQHDRGFRWVGALSDLLAEYESNRSRYPTFDAFMPKVIAFFNTYEGQAATPAGPAPKVVSMIPANGASDVDPKLTEIKITFDCPMKDKSWAVIGGGPNFPEIVGEVSYDEKCLVFTIPVRLKPDWNYQLWLNRYDMKDFRSREGVPLESVEVTFKTGSRTSS